MTRLAPRAFFVIVVLAQLALLVAGNNDVHKRFGFQPFNEADSWSATIVQTTAEGHREISDAEWNSLIGHARLTSPSRDRHATSGAASTFDYLDRALDWLAETEGGHWRAEIEWFQNGEGPRTTVVESAASLDGADR